jgi:hypothetical protein
MSEYLCGMKLGGLHGLGSVVAGTLGIRCQSGPFHRQTCGFFEDVREA